MVDETDGAEGLGLVAVELLLEVDCGGADVVALVAPLLLHPAASVAAPSVPVTPSWWGTSTR